MTILSRIVETKRADLAARRCTTPMSELEARIAQQSPPRGFRAALDARQGPAVIAEIKNDSELRHITIIMQTGMDSPEQIREGIDAGVFYYLTKPVQESVLDSVVGAAVRDVESRRSLRPHGLGALAGALLGVAGGGFGFAPLSCPLPVQRQRPLVRGVLVAAERARGLLCDALRACRRQVRRVLRHCGLQAR